MLHVKFEPEIRQQRAATPYWELYTKAEKNEFTLTKITSNKTCLYSNFYADTTGGCSSCAPYIYIDMATNKTISESCNCNRNHKYTYIDGTDEMKIRVRDDRRIEHNGFSEFLSLADKKAFETDDLNFENRVKYQSHCNQQKLAYMRTNHWLDQSTRVLTASYCVVPFTAFIQAQEDIALSNDVSGCFRAVFHFDRLQLVTPKYEIFVGQTYPPALVDTRVILFHFVFQIFPLYFIMVEVIEMKVLLKGYVISESKLWNILDIFVHTLSLIVGFGFQPDLYQFFEENSTFNMVDAFTLLEKNQRYTDTTAFVMFLSTIRLIKHFGGVSQSSRLPMLTIFMAIYDSRSFLLFLMIWIVACGCLTNFIFGTMFHSFRSPSYAMVAIGRSTLGDVDFDQFSGTNMEVQGPIILVFLTVFTLYFVFTMFVSIIDNAYQKTKVNLIREEQAKLIQRKSLKIRKKYCGDYMYAQLIDRFPFINQIKMAAKTERDKIEHEIEKIEEDLNTAEAADLEARSRQNTTSKYVTSAEMI